tara:strand:+ start:608 stop:1309 length:702 start_codon:yes stop_codon:yes gene_type:complete
MTYTGKDFSLALEKVQKTALRIYNNANKANLSNDVIVKELLDLDLDNIIKKDMDKELEKLMIQYAAELKAMQSFADISENVIESLIRTDLIVYQNKIKDKIDVMRKLMIESVIGDLPVSEFENIVGLFGLTPSQAEALVDDSLRKFSRNVTREMANNAPEDYLYIWEGPIDDRTSDECLRLMALGPMTINEFESVNPGAFYNGTHFGCRHEPQRFTRKEQFKGEQVERQKNEA